MTMLVELVRHHVWLVGRMIDRAGELTDERLDTPIELSIEGIDRDPTPRSLLTGLVSQLERWNAAVDNREYDEVPAGESTVSMRARLTPAGKRFVDQVLEVTEQDRLDETFVDASSGRAYIFTYAGMIAHVLTYAAHRRTLVAGALASAGADLDDDPLSWFAPKAEETVRRGG